MKHVSMIRPASMSFMVMMGVVVVVMMMMSVFITTYVTLSRTNHPTVSSASGYT